MPRIAPSPIVRAEVHHNNSPACSIRHTTDLVPYLNYADVFLAGDACAPYRTPIETLPVRLGIFDGARVLLDKTVVAQKQGGFQRIPLVYEHAYGGVGFAENVFGVGANAGTGAPNLVDPVDPKRRAGFGPIGRTWPERKRLLGTAIPKVLGGHGILEIPDAFDWSYFQAAPPDQRLPFLRGDEWIVIDGVHAQLPRLRVRLPGARGRGRVYGLGPWGVAEGEPIALHADMLRIESDTECCTLTFRATFPVSDEAALAAVRVVLGVELSGQPIAWPDRADLVATPIATLNAVGPRELVRTERFIEDGKSLDGVVPQGTAIIETPGAPSRSETLPFRGTADSPSALRQANVPPPAQWGDRPWSGTLSISPEEGERASHGGALPFGESKFAPPPDPPPIPPPQEIGAPLAAPISAAPAAPDPRERFAPSAPAEPQTSTSAAPPPPLIAHPAPSTQLRKGLYSRFGGKS